MIKKFNFVYDKKSGDLLNPRFVTAHSVALREYVAYLDHDKDCESVLARFPEDYSLVTIDFCYPDSVPFNEVRTEFIDLVSLKRGDPDA